jgi:hypothetical protein
MQISQTNFRRQLTTHVVPNTEHENHAGEATAHLSKTTLGVEAIVIGEDLADVGAPVLGDGVATLAEKIVRVGESNTILDVESLDLAENTARSQELGDDSDLLGGVDLEAAARTVL